LYFLKLLTFDLDATMKEDISAAKIVQKSFFRRYAFFVVFVPSLIGLHIGWYYLQFDTKLVPKSRRELKVFGVHIVDDKKS
jgi:hypothetical protein